MERRNSSSPTPVPSFKATARAANRLKVVLLGHKNTGKSAYVRRLVYNDFRAVKYLPGEDSQPRAPQEYLKRTRLENGTTYESILWDCSWEMISSADQAQLLTIFGGAHAVLYFMIDSEIGCIDKFDACVAKTFELSKQLVAPSCLYGLALNFRLNQAKETYLHAARIRAEKMHALFCTMDVQQNTGVNESWIDIINTIHYTTIARKTTLSPLLLSTAAPATTTRPSVASTEEGSSSSRPLQPATVENASSRGGTCCLFRCWLWRCCCCRYHHSDSEGDDDDEESAS